LQAQIDDSEGLLWGGRDLENQEEEEEERGKMWSRNMKGRGEGRE